MTCIYVVINEHRITLEASIITSLTLARAAPVIRLFGSVVAQGDSTCIYIYVCVCVRAPVYTLVCVCVQALVPQP